MGYIAQSRMSSVWLMMRSLPAGSRSYLVLGI